MSEIKTSLRYFWYQQQVSKQINLNGLIYFLRKLPLVGKLIPVKIYKNYELKQILAIFILLASLFLKVLMKFMFVALAFGLSWLLNKGLDFNNQNFAAGFICWLFLTPLFWRFIEAFYQAFEKSSSEFISNFNLSAVVYLRMELSVKLVYDALCYLPVFLVAILVFKLPLLLIISLFLAYLASSWGLFYLCRRLTAWPKIIRIVFSIVMSLLIFGALVALLYFGDTQETINFLANPLVIIFLGGLAWVSAKLLFNDPREEVYLNYMVAKSNDLIQWAASQTNASGESQTYFGEGLKMQKQLTLDGSDFSHLKGGNYLNALLFSRYRKMLQKQLIISLAGIFIVGGVGIAFVYFAPNVELSEAAVLRALPSLFFLMYLITFGKKVVQLAFVNCDSSMLYYPFYRQPKVILQGFMYRFWQTFKLNGTLALAIFSLFVIFSSLHGQFLSLAFFALLALLLLSLVSLFSFHELFVYYILQPFTSDLTVINPLYKVITGGFYFLAYLNLNLKVSGLGYLLIVSSLSLAYVIIGLGVIFLVAPRTFKFKG